MRDVEHLHLAQGITWEVSIIGLTLTAFTMMSIFTKRKLHRSDLLLCFWLILLNIPLLHTVFSALNIASPLFYKLTNPTLNLLHGPILYLYVRMLTSKKLTLKASELLHFIPFVIFYSLLVSMSHPERMTPLPPESGGAMGPVGGNPITLFFEPLFIYFGIINGLYFLGYAIVTICTLLKHQKTLSSIFSQIDNQISLRWIYALPATYAAVVLINIINEKILAPETRFDGLLVHTFSFTFVILLLCFFGVKQKPVFHFRQSVSIKNRTNATQEHKSTHDSDTHKSDEPIKTSTFVKANTDQNHKETNELGISPELIASVVEQMEAYMRSEKPYTDPDFSVYSLAEALNVPRRVLSVVLNSGLSKNFYLYVNEFRIEEVKALLASKENNQSTILDIAYQSGFKSKSSFNSLFKQHCALTPSQYRKRAKIGPDL